MLITDYSISALIVLSSFKCCDSPRFDNELFNMSLRYSIRQLFEIKSSLKCSPLNRLDDSLWNDLRHLGIASVRTCRGGAKKTYNAPELKSIFTRSHHDDGPQKIL